MLEKLESAVVLIVTQFLISALAVASAGVLLARCADRIAEITGLGGLLVGSILLATTTALPELTVDINAVRQGMSDLAIGDLFGSNLINLLILAVADLLHKSRGRAFSRASVAHALSATQSMALTALAGLGILLSPHFGEYAVGGVSCSILAIVAAYLLGLRLIFRDQQKLLASQSGQQRILPLTGRNSALLKSLSGFLVGAVIIVLAAPFLVESAGAIADQTGLGKTFIGTSLVAACTSLPELVSTMTAVRMGAYDLALGNIFGSNAFNMLLLAPLDLVANGSLLSSVSPTHVVTSLAIIVVTAVAVMGQLYQVETRKTLIEPDAMLIIVLVIGSLGLVYFLR